MLLSLSVVSQGNEEASLATPGVECPLITRLGITSEVILG